MTHMRKTHFTITAALAFALMAASAQAQQQVAASFQMPVQLDAVIESLDCTNNPGPRISFSGAIALSGLAVEFIFRNNEKGTHEHSETVTTTATVISGDTITIPKQPVDGGVGGNPFIWIQLLNGKHEALTGEIFLGRCVQGPITQDFHALVNALANVAVTDCTNNPGPFIELDGSVGFAEGIKARFIFRNNDNPVGGPHTADAVSDVVLVPAGFALRFEKQPVLGGVGGNPWISVQFMNAGQPVGTETLLGRCVQLLPGN